MLWIEDKCREKKVDWRPFVMNTQAEIQQAYSDYSRTRFGGWPWPQDAMVFPRDKGRFASVNGVESRPVVTERQHV
eukprot:COSAG05_NODE_143_length_16570_cov_12.041953_6_plen_76_part_00